MRPGRVLISLLILAGCKQKGGECESCKNLPPDRSVVVTIANNRCNAKVWEGKSNYHFAYVETNSAVLADALKITATTLETNTTLATVVLYLSNFPQVERSVVNKDVLGYGIYFLKEDKLRYRFYLKSARQFKIIPELNCEAQKMRSNDISDISNLFFGGQQSVFALGITCRDLLFMPNLSKSHTLGYNINYLYRKMPQQVNGRVTALPVTNCQPPCSGGDQGCSNTLHGWSCDYTTTGENDAMQANALKDQNLESQETIDKAYDMTLHYSFRDSFLLVHRLSKKYADYYYGMTPCAYLTSDILTKMPDYLQKVNAKISQLLSRQNDVVLIDQQFKDETLGILKLYEAAAPNDEERAYFFDIENDVTRYAGRKIGDVVLQLD